MKKTDISAVTYKLLDGVTPTKIGGLVQLKARDNIGLVPTVPNTPEGRVTVIHKVGVTFDCPLLLLPSNSVKSDGVTLVNEFAVVDAGREPTITLSSTQLVRYDRGQTIAYGLPLWDGYTLKKSDG